MKKTIVYLFVLVLIIQGCKNNTNNKNENDSLNVKTDSDLAELFTPPISNYQFTTLQSNAINLLLKDNINFVLANRTDCINSFLADELRENPSYEPFFIESDLNMDGRKDIAVVIKKDSLFSLFWFVNYDSTYSKPMFLSSQKWFNECGLFNYKRPGSLGIGRFRSDVGIFYEWNDSLQVLQEVLPTEE